MNTPSLIGTLVILSQMISVAAQADIRAGCFLENKADSKIEAVGNTNVDSLQTLASTSKMVTTEWALEKLGPDYRFETKFHIERVVGSDGEASIHIQGGYDPYFGSNQLKFVRDELTRLGVKKVIKLTFDENFKFLLSPRSSPNTNGVINTKTGWRFGYPSVERVDAELKLAGIPKAEYLAAKDFQVTSATETFSLPSPPLTELLRDMNRLSNNYVANVLFDFLGGPEGFKKRNEELRIADHYDFVNGSGMWVIEDGEKMYNKGSCRALVESIQHTYKMLTEAKHSFEEVVAINGVYADEQCSTMDGNPNANTCKGGAYEIEPLIGAISAKTGYVNSTVALAGKASAQQADVFFAYLATPGGGRIVIRQALVDMLKRFGGAKQLDFKPSAFNYFPKGSQLNALQQVKGKLP